MQTTSIYHLARASEWQRAQETGVYEGSVEDRRDGFLHFSTAAQIVESARRHRAGERDLVLLRVHVKDCGDALRWEESRNGALFPHLYGSLRVEFVQESVELALDADAMHVFPELKQ